MFVHIIGPNLRDQSKGDMHVHARGCADVNRDPNYAGPAYEWDRNNTFNVMSRIDASELIYADQINEGSMTAAEGVDTMWFAPCVSALPDEAPEATSVDTTGLPAEAVTVLNHCRDEAWRNVNNGDAHTEADVAADIVRLLINVYGEREMLGTG